MPWTHDTGPPGTVDVSITFAPVEPIPHRAGAGVACSFDEGVFRLSVEGVARYRVRDGSVVEVEPVDGAAAEDLQLYLTGAVFGAVWHQRSVLALHASAVMVDRRCLLFGGRSGAGKSTVAAAFERAGFPMVADDVAVLTLAPAAQTVAVWPSGPQFKLAHDSVVALGQNPDGLSSAGGTRGKRHLPARVRAEATSGPVPLHRYYLLDRGPSAGKLRIEVLLGLAAIDAVGGHTYCDSFLHPLGRGAEWLHQVSLVARRIGVRRLVRPWRLDRLDEAVAAVLEDAASGELVER